jgi:hypothetical protein
MMEQEMMDVESAEDVARDFVLRKFPDASAINFIGARLIQMGTTLSMYEFQGSFDSGEGESSPTKGFIIHIGGKGGKVLGYLLKE